MMLEKMKYIIMCGGTYTKWKKPRQFLEIEGEPIVARTIRLLKEAGVEEIYISSDNPDFEQYAPVLCHTNRYEGYGHDSNGKWLDCFYPTEEPACYIFGDVVFSPEAIRTIVETDTDDIEFFASAPPFAKEYIKDWAEPFALKVKDQKRLRRAIRQTDLFYRQGQYQRKPIMWELWQVLKGYPFNEIHYDTYTHINDYTCDVDDIYDLTRIQEALCKR